MGRGARSRVAALLALLAGAGLLLAGCGDDTSGGAQQNAAAQGGGGGSDGSLVSLAQAEQGARQWWSDHEQALVHRDPTALTRLDADPGALVTVEALRVSEATNTAMLGQPRTPQAVRVHVPAAQSWPVPIIAVFDLAGRGGTTHLAVLLVARSGGAALVALETAVLDTAEPAFDVDGAGYVRMIAAADQQSALGRSASDLSSEYGKYMSVIAHGGAAPTPAAFADGQHTSVPAQKDASFINAAAAHQSSSVGSVQLGYLDLNFPTPVFGLQGGGGFTIFAVQRNETLMPTQGQAFLQDQARHNYGGDLAPGQYPSITMHSIVMVAARIPAGGAPVVALGTGGGTYSEG